MDAVYRIEQADRLNPEHPVVFELEVFEGDYSPILRRSQPGPFLGGDWPAEMFVDLETLVRIGETAKAILANQREIERGGHNDVPT
jgi:hypothetical protein